MIVSPRVDEDLGEHFQGLLRPMGDDDLLRVGAQFLLLHDVAESVLEGSVSVGGTVLECARTVLGEDAGGKLRKHLGPQYLGVGQAARQGDDVGARGDREEVADLRGDH